MKNLITSAADKLENSFDLVKHYEKQSLDDVIEIQILLRTLLQNEALRLEQKLGADHSRVINIGRQLKKNLNLITRLNVEKEIKAISVPEISEGSALVHGRITDKNARGISHLIVCLADADSNSVGDEFESVTDNSGYFSIILNENFIGEMYKKYPNGIYLNIIAPSGKLIYRARKAIKIEKGKTTSIEIPLDRRMQLQIGDSVNTEKDTINQKQTEHEDKHVSTPNLIGIKLASARKKIRKFNLNVGKISHRKSQKPEVVISQNPKEGTIVNVGSDVHLVVGKVK